MRRVRLLVVNPRPHPVITAHGFSGLGAVQILPASTVSTIASTIQQVEGYYPGSVAYRNNNPGNLIYAGQAGATPGTPMLDSSGNVVGHFAQFQSYADGQAALANQIQLYASRGMTIQDMMNVYAPASVGNNPTAYAAEIAASLGVSPSASLSDLSAGGASALPLATGDTSAADVTGGGFFDSMGTDLSSVDPLTVGVLLAIGGAVLLL